VSRILVIGGYGGFGARLCRRLRHHHLLVGGRSEEKARRFCAGLPSAEPVRVDREGDVAAVLARLRPGLVIDAAGPFQGSGYDAPSACIAAGIPYLDLADARDFVAGAAALDAEARRAEVSVVAGASSVPALSGAVARRLALGLESVSSVDVAISASNRASGGEAVMAAILSYVGRPIRAWRGGRWTRLVGWQELRRENFVMADGGGVRGRLVALADVPDLELLPALLPGRPAVAFRAGTELSFQMAALWLASWPVRWGWVHSLSPLRRLLVPLYRMTRALGGASSAMSVTLKGSGVERRWTLVADKGEGLEVPTMAAAILAERILAGALPAGSLNAASLLEIEDFAAAFAGLAIRHETIERPLPEPLYRRVLGPRFALLPPAVRAIHDVAADAGAAGEGEVIRGRSLPARLLGAIMRFPPSGKVPLHVHFAARGGVERWTRDFGGHRFASELSGRGERIVERFGPLAFHFDISAAEDGLGMHLRRWTCLGLPLPPALAPRIAAREWEEEGRFRFDVAVEVPLAGDVVRYSGWLAPTCRMQGTAR
jgi:hypothetical protein